MRLDVSKGDLNLRDLGCSEDEIMNIALPFGPIDAKFALIWRESTVVVRIFILPCVLLEYR